MTPFIVPIVEGHGETEAVPLLFRRIAELCGVYCLTMNPPLRVKAYKFLNDDDEFRRYIILAAGKAAQAKGKGIVIIILDCEDDCPAQIGPILASRARAINSSVTYFVFLAYREYETWFISSIESLREHKDVRNNAEMPNDPETIRGAKEWLSGRMLIPYDPILHQTSFTKKMDLVQACRNRSFARLFQKLSDWFNSI